MPDAELRMYFRQRNLFRIFPSTKSVELHPSPSTYPRMTVTTIIDEQLLA
jgi:hypothetical protein